MRLARNDRSGLRTIAEEVARNPASSDDDGFAALISALVTERAESAILRMGHAFLGTSPSHIYRDNVLIILYWNLGGEESEEARKLIAGRWRTIDRGTWDKRLQRGDYSAWQERLVGYCYGKVMREELFRGLESERVFAASSLSRIGQPYRSLLTDARFYDTLCQAITGDATTRVQRMAEALQSTIEAKQLMIWEYHMARYLLGRIPGGNEMPQLS
jgi:hypothetical protein